jgi:Sir2- and TIR-associating SLOG family
MISQAGVAIFISGTSRSSLVSAGVMDEYRIARAFGKVPTLIGDTDFAAEQIWNEVAEKPESVYGDAVPEALFAQLNDRALSNEQILQAVFQLIDRTAAH